MDSKYTKIAVILVITSFVIVSTVFAVIVLVVRGPSLMGKASTPPCTLEQVSRLAEDLVLKSATYRFDGIDGSLQPVKVEPAKAGGSWKLNYVFTTGHPGHGDRTGQVLAQVITSHDVVITFKDCKMISAVCDGDWDLAADRQLPAE